MRTEVESEHRPFPTVACGNSCGVFLQISAAPITRVWMASVQPLASCYTGMPGQLSVVKFRTEILHEKPDLYLLCSHHAVDLHLLCPHHAGHPGTRCPVTSVSSLSKSSCRSCLDRRGEALGVVLDVSLDGLARPVCNIIRLSIYLSLYIYIYTYIYIYIHIHIYI